MAKQYTKEFKEDAVRYFIEHQDLGLTACAKKLGISKSVLSTWRKIAATNDGVISTRGRGNFESDEAKENARLRKELRDTFHSSELWYMFGTLERSWRPKEERDFALSKEMLDYWSNFMKTGDPNGEGLKKWEPCMLEKSNVKEFE